MRKCPRCKGQGFVIMTISFRDGSGRPNEYIENRCELCRGTGLVSDRVVSLGYNAWLMDKRIKL